MKILIAEDDLISQKTLANMLKDYGEVICTDNGEKAFELFIEANDSNKPFELVFLDIQMPGFNGQETLIAMRDYEEERFLPRAECACIVITSSLSDGENIYEAHMHGCDNYLLKPLSKKAIDKVVLRAQEIKQERIGNNPAL